MNLQRGSVDFLLVTQSAYILFWPYCRQTSLLRHKISGAFGLYNRGLSSVRHRGAVYAVCDSSESLEKAMWKALWLCASGKDGGADRNSWLVLMKPPQLGAKAAYTFKWLFASVPICHQSITPLFSTVCSGTYVQFDIVGWSHTCYWLPSAVA